MFFEKTDFFYPIWAKLALMLPCDILYTPKSATAFFIFLITGIPNGHLFSHFVQKTQSEP